MTCACGCGQTVTDGRRFFWGHNRGRLGTGVWSQARQNAYQRLWREQRRAKGLCMTCPNQSARHWRCFACRLKSYASKARRAA